MTATTVDVNAARATVLVVDDDIRFGLMVKDLLAAAGFHVVVATSAQEAVSLADANGDTRLAVIDIDLGAGVDGIDVAYHILHRGRLPVMFFTANTQPDDLRRASKITNHIVPKNIAPATFVHQVKALVPV